MKKKEIAAKMSNEVNGKFTQVNVFISLCKCVGTLVLSTHTLLDCSIFSFITPWPLFSKSPHAILRALKSPTIKKGSGNCTIKLRICLIFSASFGVIYKLHIVIT